MPYAMGLTSQALVRPSEKADSLCAAHIYTLRRGLTTANIRSLAFRYLKRVDISYSTQY